MQMSDVPELSAKEEESLLHIAAHAEKCHRCESDPGVNNSINTCHACYCKESNRGDMWQSRAEKAEKDAALWREQASKDHSELKNWKDCEYESEVKALKSRIGRLVRVVQNTRFNTTCGECHWPNSGMHWEGCVTGKSLARLLPRDLDLEGIE